MRLTESQALAGEIDATLHQFMHMPSPHCYTVNTLWIMHTHLRDHTGRFVPQRTPRLYFGSNNAGSGKTLGMELTTLMSHNGEIHVNPTQFALVTAINHGLGTNGLDEIDRFFGTRGTSKADVQTIVLAGYKSGSHVTRQRSDVIERQNIHGPMVMAGKNLNRFLTSESFETLRTRSIVIALERKPANTHVDKFQSEMHEPRLKAISARLKGWGQRNAFDICSVDVNDTMDRIGLDNRDEEIWSILFRVADHIGGDWPHRIEAAARAIVLGQWEDEIPIQSPAEELLMWCRAVITDDPDDEFIRTRDLIQRLMTNAPRSIWFRREWRNPMAASKGLASTLAIFSIEADRHYVDNKQERGYWRSDFVDNTDPDDTDPDVVPLDEWDWSSVE